MGIVHLSLINTRKAKNDKKSPQIVELRMTFERKTKYLSTGIRVPPCCFKNGRVTPDYPNWKELNDTLNALLNRGFSIVHQMEQSGMIDFEYLPKAIRSDSTNKTFWEYIEEQSELKNVRESTRKRYETFLRQIKKWKMFRTFSELNVTELMKFAKLLRDNGYEKSTIQSYHKYLRQFCNDAIADAYIKTSPYSAKRVRVERAEPRKDKFLTSEEIKAIESVILPKHLARVRDMFIFSVYTGLAFSDMLDFSKDKVVEFDGELVIDGERLKDGVQYIIPLVSQAKACLDRQNWDFGTISNAKYNEYIKVVAARAKVDKPISSHWARHTAGMLMLNNGVPIEIVSRVLGHANINTTQRVYAHVRMKAVVREVKKFQQSI